MSAWIANLPLRRKLLLLCLFGLMMMAAPATMVLRSSVQELRAIQSERTGMPPSRALLEVVRLMQEHRGLSNAFLSGDATRLPLMKERQGLLDAALGQAQTTVDELGDAATSDMVKDIRTAWAALHPPVHQQAVAAADSVQRHTALVVQAMHALEEVAAVSGLALDPHAESYFLIQALLRDQPRLTEQLGLARARGAAMLVKGDTTDTSRQALTGLSRLAQTHAGDARRNLQRAEHARPRHEQADALNQALVQATEAMTRGVALIDRLVKQHDVAELTATGYFAATTEVILAQFKLGEVAMQRLETLLAQRERHLQMQLAGMVAVVLLAVAMGGYVAWAVMRTTATAVAQGMQLAQALARGDLTVQLQHVAHDEIGQMVKALGEATATLRHTLHGVRAASESVATAASQIAQGNQDLSARTEHQASSLEETASSMEEMSGTVQHNAATATQASQLAHSASQEAQHSGQVFAQVVGKMGEIRQTSARIAEINSVIDGIAFQTNILALNAAVEAARAGEQGRGFAVVAGEVRTLAQRSAQAAREIKSLISSSVDSVEQGYELASRSGESVDRLIQQVQQVNVLMSEIASASEQQNLGIQQVNQAVSTLDETTQQNAALVEQSSAAATSLNDQAIRLQQSVAGFRLA